MAYVQINQVLGAPNLCGVIQTTRSGIRDPFIEAYPQVYKPDKQVHGNTASYKVYPGQRSVARTTNYGSPSQNRQSQSIGEYSVMLIHSLENTILPVTDFINLLAYDSLERQAMGVQEVTRRIGDARKAMDNLTMLSTANLIFNGAIYRDSNGDILTPTQAAAYAGPLQTYSAQVPIGNTGQLNPLGTGNIITQDWSVASANIDQQIQTLHQQAEELTGYTLKHAFYGKNIAHYLTMNTGLGNYFYRDAYRAGGFNPSFIETADIPNPLLGLQWHKAYNCTYIDYLGNPQVLIGNNQVVFTPDFPEWFGFLEGSYPVPNQPNIITEVEPGIVTSMNERYGMFSYGQQCNDPVTAKIVYGTTFAPVVKVPNAIFNATVSWLTS